MNKAPQITKPLTMRKKKQNFHLDSNILQYNEGHFENNYFPPSIKTPNHQITFSSNFTKTFQDFNFQNNIPFSNINTSNNSLYAHRSNQKALSSKNLGVIVSPRNSIKSLNNSKKLRSIEEIAQSHNLKYNFKFPLQNPDSSNKNNNFFPSITKLNKELIQSSIFQGKYQVEYSKKNYDTVIDYLHNKEEDGENKAKRIGKEFKDKKKIAVGDLVPQSRKMYRHSKQRLTQNTFERIKTKQEANLNSRQKVKSIMFAHKLMNLMEQNKTKKQRNKRNNYRTSLSEPSIISHNETKEQKSIRTNFDKVDFGLLRQKINIHNLLKRKFHKANSGSSVDLDIKEDLGENFSFGTNHSIKYGLKPHFLKGKFKRQTMYKYDGITGKFFGTPV